MDYQVSSRSTTYHPPIKIARRKRHPISSAGLLGLLTLFELFCMARIWLANGDLAALLDLVPLLIVAGSQWIYFAICVMLGRRHIELEVSAFFLSFVSLSVLIGMGASGLLVQTICFLLGLVLFNVLLWLLNDLTRVMKYKYIIGGCGVILLLVNIVFGSIRSGAQNWIEIGPVTIQPSEIVKIIFIIIGAASLDRLQSSRHLTWFLLFFAAIMGTMVYISDFGTACIFFLTFLIIAFMRSGDWRTLFLVCAGAAGGVALVLKFKSYVLNRFAAWGNVWQYADTSGYQQTRLLAYSASGGLLGLGPGKGYLEEIFASDTDLIIGVLCEEWGMLLALVVLSVYAAWTFYAVRLVGRSSSSFYAISSCDEAVLILFQTCLNIFGATDLLPMTGVTLPFISRGGSSIIASWGLLAFIKAADPRTYERRVVL